ncbi:TLDc domain-containing protein [Entamoeba marina]
MKSKELKRQEDQTKHDVDEKLKELNGMKYSYDTDVCNSIKELPSNDTRIQQDKEIIELIPSFNKLKEWSGKQICSIIFDSDIDGDGTNNVLMNKVMNKKNLYFISFDNENNVFGGYVDITIDTTGLYTTDPNSFTFSLIRNGKMKNIKYNIKNDHQLYAFYLRPNDFFYTFGGSHDILVYKIGNSNSHCDPYSYEYNGEKHPFVDNFYFITKRILVLK